MKRPISMGNFPGRRDDQKGRQSGKLVKNSDLMKSHQSLLYNGQSNLMNEGLQDPYQMQKKIDAQ